MHPAGHTGPIAAVIDIGSSSVRLAVAARAPATSLLLIHESRTPTRLAQGLDRSGQISDRAIRQTLAVVTKMVASARAHRARFLRIVATAAMRDATNAKALAALIQTACEHPVEILPGADEARLGFLGAIGSFPPDAALPEHLAIVDIGGGSTQLSRAYDRELRSAQSVPIGAVRLHDLRLTLPGGHDRQALTDHAKRALEAFTLTHPLPQLLIATGGTASALAMMHHQASLSPDQAAALRHLSRSTRAGIIQSVRLTADQLDSMLDLLFSTPSTSIAKTFHIQPDRAELLPAGAAILSSLCAMLARPPLAFTTGSIRDAILLDLLTHHPASHILHPTSTHTPNSASPIRLPSSTPGG